MIILLDIRRGEVPEPYDVFREIYGKDNVYRLSDAETLPTSVDPHAVNSVVIANMHCGFCPNLSVTPTYIALLPDPKKHAILSNRGRNLRRALGNAAKSGRDNPITRMVAGLPQGGGPCPASALETAEDNLRTLFAGFGLAEDINRSIVLFGKKLGWRRYPLYAMPETARIAPVKLSAADMRAIEEFCTQDIALYAYARGLFEESIADIPGFEKAVRIYEAELADVEKILREERAKWSKEASSTWRILRKPKAKLAELRRNLGLGTRLRALLHLPNGQPAGASQDKSGSLLQR